MNNKALSDQFNWIFIIIAGAVILLFFFSMIQKQQSLSLAKTDSTIVRQIETLVTVAGTEKNTVSTKEVPNIDLSFQCRKRGISCECSYTSGSMSRDFNQRIIFAPKKITGTQLHLWSLSWDVPNRITNFLFASNDRHKYIIVKNNNQNLFNEIKKLIPERFNVQYVDAFSDVSSIQNNNYESVTIALLNTPTSGTNLNTPMQFKGITKFVVVNPSSNEINIGSEKRYYLETPQILGALFSSDVDMFECNSMKSFERLEAVASIQIGRITKISSALTTTPPTRSSCTALYGTITAPLQNIYTNAKTLRDGLLTSTTSSSSPVSIIKTNSQLLKNKNEDLVRNGCPSIY
ncbi:hypothetical protein HY483_01255 [Candidatus Woesearchaeota archaeon]|nr:hypothetical protein [Candidatus Woesearchaeota archaeon]